MENVNEKAVRKEARKVLSNYLSLKRIAGSSNFLQSVTYSDMPKSDSNRNYQEERVIKHIEAKQAYEDIKQAIELLPEIHQEILKRRYFKHIKETTVSIGMALGYSERTIERYFAIALIEFAEAYRNGALLYESESA